MSKDDISLVYSGKTICVKYWPCNLLAHQNNNEKPKKAHISKLILISVVSALFEPRGFILRETAVCAVWYVYMHRCEQFGG